jgi:Ni/Co efflux regulator RcnB
MKKLLFASALALTFAGPLAISTALADPGPGRHRDQSEESRYPSSQNDDRREDARDHRRDRRERWRDDRRDARFDEREHNGYYYRGRWHYGPPPDTAYGRHDFAPGYHPWRRGQRLGYYNGRYAEVDYRSYPGLRRPPRGYHWVRNDGGDLLLAAIAGGLIAQVIINSGR